MMSMYIDNIVGYFFMVESLPSRDKL